VITRFAIVITDFAASRSPSARGRRRRVLRVWVWLRQRGGMATERSAMHVVREIIRQKLALKRSHRQTAASVGVSAGKVASVFTRARALGLDAAGADRMSDGELAAAFHPKTPEGCTRPAPDCAALHIELRRPGVKLALLHLEYLTVHADGFRYTAFCDRYREWSKRASPVMRQTHTAGDKLFVDYSGKKARLVDPATGEITEVEFFVAVLGASNYTYAEATHTQQVGDFVSSVARALHAIGGVPRAVVPDQLRSAVSGPDRYDPAIQRTTSDLGRHYGTTILPARPRSPRDKAKVEGGVLIAQRWLLARIRNERFATLGELNARLRELTDDLNGRTMRTYKASRRELWERLDKPALLPLPSDVFEVSSWKKVTLNIDYHFQLDGHLYSAPYLFVHEELWTRMTSTTVEAFRADNGERVAAYARSYVHGGRTTLPEHMPSTHRAHAEWTPSRIIGWAAQVGPNAAAFCEVMLQERRHPEWGYRSCLSLLRLTKKYGNDRVDAASKRALYAGARIYRHAKTILQHGLDLQPLPAPERAASNGKTHGNVRGRDYYN
jgi:transposase